MLNKILVRLQEIRMSKGLSTYKLAQLANIPQSTIASWYQKNNYPSIPTLEALCDAMGISVAEFFADSETTCDDQYLIISKWTLLDSKEKELLLAIADAIVKTREA